jgi:DNA-binding XRE family transcriptional regulator
VTVGAHLRRSRFEHGAMIQEASAKYVGVTHQTIVALETKRCAPSLKLAMRLASVFSLKTHDTFLLKTSEAPPLHLKGGK